MTGPLEGLRIVEIGEGPAVAAAGRNLADMGADVIKVEPPAGDGIRQWPGPEVLGAPAVFHALHRGKSSLMLDLADADDRQALARLLAVADAAIDGTPGGVVRQLAPADTARGLVVARITPYGDGVDAEMPSHDAVIQAESGWMSINGRPDFECVRSGLHMPSVAAGASAAQGLLACLIAREDDGLGDDVDVAVFDQGVVLGYHYAMMFLVDGARPKRFGNGSALAEPLGVFDASDGQFQVTVAGDRVWKRFAPQVLGRPDLTDDPRFAENSGRVANKAALYDIMEPLFRSQTRDFWIAKMMACNVPGGSIRDIDEAVASPESVERGLIVSAEAGGGVATIRNPMRFRETPLADPRPAPGLNAGGAAAVQAWGET